jgi:phage shock protein PspC (stress-responsive transcriptional regulator)
MNEILRIHIAGVPYEIDIAARKQLNKYMDDIKTSLGDASDALDDIEIRITEILESRGVNKNDVIKPADVTAIKEQLGEPKEFSSDGKGPGKKDRGENIADKVRSTIAEKRYFRDTENGILGGVIAGFAAYTGWDVTLLRVLFVVLCFCTAVFPLAVLYLVVWICAPEARTAGDRLSMKGEPINLETIKSATADIAEKTKSTAKSAGEKISKAAAPAGNIALRIISGFFGILGLVVFISTLVAMIPITVLAIFSIIGAAIAMKPLFVASMIIIAILIYAIISVGITASSALLSAKTSKATNNGLVASIVLIIALAVGASVTSSIWYANVGHDQAVETVRDLVDDFGVRVHSDEHGERVKVDIGPIHVDTSR